MIFSILLNIILAAIIVIYFFVNLDRNEDKQKALRSTLSRIRDKAQKIKTPKQLYTVTREFAEVLTEPKTDKNLAIFNELKAYLDMRHADLIGKFIDEPEENFQ